MTQHERDTLVECYLSGEMTPEQESNFFLQVALDTELQRTLKAYRIIDRALERERSESIGSRSKYRKSVMALLAVTQAATVAGTAVPAASGISSAASGGSAIGVGTVTATGLSIGLKALLATILGASLVVGTFFVVDAVSSNDQPRTGSKIPPSAEQQLQQKPASPPAVLETSSEAIEIPSKEKATPSTSGGPNTLRSSATSKVREGGETKRGSAAIGGGEKFNSNKAVQLPPVTNKPVGKADVNPNAQNKMPKQDR